jgi:hypothetical protein
MKINRVAPLLAGLSVTYRGERGKVHHAFVTGICPSNLLISVHDLGPRGPYLGFVCSSQLTYNGTTFGVPLPVGLARLHAQREQPADDDGGPILTDFVDACDE